MLGLVGEATVSRLPWPTYRAVLRILRPAEFHPEAAHCRCGKGPCDCAGNVPSHPGWVNKNKERRLQALRLLPAFRSAAPHRAAAPENSQAARPAHPHVQCRQPTGDHLAAAPASSQPSATAIRRWNGQRGAGYPQARGPGSSALADLPRQARRLVRWRMRQEKSPNPSFKSPLRPGRPPGHRRRATHDIDELLSECHWLAHYAAMPDTS